MIVQTNAGQVQGFEKDGVLSFRGIPFAAPPVGAGRFRPPSPVEPSTATLDCTTYGPLAPQTASPLEAMLGQGNRPQDEERCLTLNVWTKGADDGGRPVLVWIHGGGFTAGSGSVPWYSGVELAARYDIVVVTLNYRLGVLGFTHLGDTLGDELAGSGNAGMLDQVAALEWVRDNIAAFGGDPARVTIFGESAGGMSVGTLLALPAARGLFQAAVAQSGAGHNVHTRDEANEVVASLLSELGLGAQSAEALLDLPTERLLEAQSAVLAQMRGIVGGGAAALPFQPVVDGDALPVRPVDAVRDGAAADVTVLVGTTAEEWNLFAVTNRQAVGSIDHDKLVRRIDRIFAPVRGAGAGAEVVATYRAGRPDASADDLFSAIATDRIFRIPAIRLAEAQAAHRDDTRMYRFSFGSTVGDPPLGACHAVEIPFVFANLHRSGVEMFLGPLDDRARVLAAATSSAWAALARRGDPNHEGLPDWPAYDLARRATMDLDVDPHLLDDPDGAEREVWTGVL